MQPLCMGGGGDETVMKHRLRMAVARSKESDMADLGGLGDKAKDFANSDKGEKAGDAALQKGDDAASSATGGKVDDKIDDARDAADGRIGD